MPNVATVAVFFPPALLHLYSSFQIEVSSDL